MFAAVLLFATAAGLSGCGNSKAPSKAAFAAALEPVVRDVFCHPIDVMQYEVEGETAGSGFPIVTSPRAPMAGPGSDGKAVAMLDGLASVGLVTRTTFEKPARWSGSTNPFVRQPLISYAPTPKGAPYLHAVERKATNATVAVPSLCLAKGEVVDVVRWTEPTDFAGHRVSQVTYTYRGVEPIPVMPPAEQARMAEPQETTMPFELQSDGWRPMPR
ncbi:hypothetical protein [Sphingomonas sp. S-NIH.Pt15_0812]|uniref:hypothetical protein n=1 Tax=Sphingomonas sp. S-NIH.Pt15_0812 TaxID=1920129 RepID=UPI000F7DF113|nr:hypothetical protein [Sphingomonas sp. S-NIH.Pt15_0812]RSU51082.1 hypothetical protein BRX43_07160 [Sphingomonas sp. S-NIH.Pt15_0812]